MTSYNEPCELNEASFAISGEAQPHFYVAPPINGQRADGAIVWLVKTTES